MRSKHLHSPCGRCEDAPRVFRALGSCARPGGVPRELQGITPARFLWASVGRPACAPCPLVPVRAQRACRVRSKGVHQLGSCGRCWDAPRVFRALGSCARLRGVPRVFQGRAPCAVLAGCTVGGRRPPGSCAWSSAVPRALQVGSSSKLSPMSAGHATLGMVPECVVGRAACAPCSVPCVAQPSVTRNGPFAWFLCASRTCRVCPKPCPRA